MEIEKGQVYERAPTGSRVKILKIGTNFLLPHTWIVYYLDGDRRRVQSLSSGTLDMVFKLVEGQ